MVDMLSIHAECDVVDLYYKQKAEFRFQKRSDNDFLKFLLDSAVRVITIVQHLTPVIRAVSQDFDDLSDYLSVGEKSDVQDNVSTSPSEDITNIEDTRDGTDPLPIQQEVVPDTSFIENTPGPSNQFSHFTESLPSQIYNKSLLCKRKGTSSSEFSPTKRKNEIEDDEVDVQHSVESIFLPSSNYDSTKDEPVMIKQEQSSDQVHDIPDSDLSAWYANLLNTLNSQNQSSPLLLSQETLNAFTDFKDIVVEPLTASSMISLLPVRIPKKMNPLDTFCLTPGRLSLLSGATRYNVTVGEVQRRLAYPESLNVSLLGAVLRRAKSKNGNHYLRQQVDLHGIKIPTGRRKCASVTLFTSLLEGEATQLSSDFNMLCEKFFPCRDLAKGSVLNDVQKYQSSELVQRVVNAKQMMADLQEITEISVVKNYEFMNNTGPMGPAGMAPVPQLMIFELLTHGFGASAISATLNIIQTYFDEMLKQLTQQL